MSEEAIISAIIGFLLIVSVLLAINLPAFRNKHENVLLTLWHKIVMPTLKCFIILVLPLLVFLFSGFMTPDWKGAAEYGWVDMMMFGKIRLIPVVLWALAALYVEWLMKARSRGRAWVGMGIASGCAVSVSSTVLGFSLFYDRSWETYCFMMIPSYVACIYCYRSYMWFKEFGRIHLALLGNAITLPLWYWSIYLAKEKYAKLPENPPNCFIVTAASCGNISIVGTNIEIQRAGQPRVVNRQLITFWQFEDTLCKKVPQVHRWLRVIYNRAGPAIAHMIYRHRLLSDFTYLLLKPLEWSIRLLSHRFM